MGPAQDLFGQLWKEYALSDSRYLTNDPFVLCMETVTAVSTVGLARVLVFANGSTAALGSSVFLRRLSGLRQSPSEVSSPGGGVPWSDLWGHLVLCNQLVQHSPLQHQLLPSRTLLLLVLLLLHEFHLDSHSWR